ncbi:MAG: hypothetical protein JWL75_15 [Parcubacteria group bacterium]|nr:hypothetical protein [Parcubacteria group bacterium]
MKSLNLSAVTKYLHYGDRLRPARDWYVLLVIFGIALGLSVGWNLWQFSQITKGQTIGVPAPAAPAQIQLDQVKTLFEQRATEQGRYTHDYRFVDPSL